MKKNKCLLLCLVCFLAISARSQNVGINTNAPQATLDVKGTQRVGGISNYMRFDSATGKIEWIGASLFTPVSQQIIRHSASSEGLYAGGGKLDYRNSIGNPVFYTDWTNGNGYFSGNLGLGDLTPAFPLSFASVLGDKISLWSNSTNSYGLGIQGSLLQIHTDISAADIAFGYGSSNSFTELMRIKGNGNVGIGITNPNAPLSFPPSVGKKITLYPGATGDVGMAVQGNLLQIYSDNPGADIALGYDQNGTMTERMRIKGNGNVGIGTTNPNAPLSFPPSFGKKITLYPGATGDVGMAVQGNLLQIYSDNPGADIAFGYDQNGTMTERMRIKGNGNVGIGIGNPQLPLDINGSMRLNGNVPNSPGMWLYNSGADRALIGLETTGYVGFYAPGVGWKFCMNTQTGALKINGNEGQLGQVLQSSGTNASPSWVQSTNALYNNTFQFTGTGPVTTSDFSTVLPIPGLTYTFSVNTNSKVLVSGAVFVAANSCAFCGSSKGYIDVLLDGLTQKEFRGSIANGDNTDISFSCLISVSPGTHTINLDATSSGPSVTSSCNFCSNMVLQIIPQ